MYCVCGSEDPRGLSSSLCSYADTEVPEGDAEPGAPYMPRPFVAAAGVTAAAAAATSKAAAVCFLTSHVPVNSAVLSSSVMPYMRAAARMWLSACA